MFSLLRNRFGIPGILSVLALVFAMAGGAYAAKKYVITSTSQIKPSVLKALKGTSGAPGAPGAAGAQGPAGANGKDGANGLPGKDGVSAVATPLAAGNANCPDGGAEVKSASAPAFVCNGSPWTAEGTLPSEATETGSWGGSAVVTKEKEEAEAEVGTLYPISFTIPLAEAPELIYVKVGETKTGCPGIVGGIPAADPGKLCVYERLPGGPVFAGIGFNPDTGAPTGPGKSGVILPFQNKTEGSIFGSWAVTAE
jgi:hypothetical protein